MSESDVKLPPNWRAARDSDGKEYYFNELTGETSWVVPEVEGTRPQVQDGDGAGATSAAAGDSGEFAQPAVEQPSMMSLPDYGAGNGGRPRSSSYYAELESLIGERVLPRLVIIVVCSFIVMLQSAVELSRALGETGTRAYGVAVGTVSLAFGLFLFTFAKLRPATFSNFVIPKLPGELSIMQAFAIFLVLWWVPGMIVLTFFNPYTTTENSYFAAWAALIASLLILGDCFTRVGDKFREFSSSRIHQDSHAKPLVGLTIASTIMACATLEYVGEGFGQAVFGLIVGILSACCAAIMYLLTDKGKIGAPELPLRTLHGTPLTPLLRLSSCLPHFRLLCLPLFQACSSRRSTRSYSSCCGLSRQASSPSTPPLSRRATASSRRGHPCTSFSGTRTRPLAAAILS